MQNLPLREFDLGLNKDEFVCSSCGKPFISFPGTEDSEAVALEVTAYRRKYRRHRYKRQCDCPGKPGMNTGYRQKIFSSTRSRKTQSTFYAYKMLHWFFNQP